MSHNSSHHSSHHHHNSHHTNQVENILQPSWNHAFVTFNNQNSVLLSMSIPDKRLVCLLHDNRIFAFNKNSSASNEQLATSSDEQNLILNMLTTLKYRVMSAVYIAFRLIDNVSFLGIIVLSIINGHLTFMDPENATLFSVIGIELFYDIMLQTNKYWNLERLSIFIGILLYVLYLLIVLRKHSDGDYKPEEFKFVIQILGARFIAFICEELVDIAIDGELHNDLLRLQRRKTETIRTLQHNAEQTENQPQNADIIEMQPQNSSTNTERQPLISSRRPKRSCCSKIEKYFDVLETVNMPDNVDYRGSFFAWSPQSVFTDNVWREQQFSRFLTVLLCFVPNIFFMVFILIPLLVLCFCAFLVPIIVALIICAISCSSCKPQAFKAMVRNFWNEMTHC